MPAPFPTLNAAAPPPALGAREGSASFPRLRRGFGWVLGIAFAWRLAFLLWTGFAIESDEAVFGLMARHIAQGREWPTWYYGQEYMGALEAYAAVPFVALLGTTPLALKLCALAFAMIYLGAAGALAVRILGQTPGLFTLLYLAVSPLVLTLWTLKLRGVASTMALGHLILLLAHAIGVRGATVAKSAALGLLAGAAVWLNLLIAPFLAAAALHLLPRRQVYARAPTLAACLGAFALGSAPLWIYNARHSWATLRVLFPGNAHPSPLVGLAMTYARHLPMLLGSVPPWGDPSTAPPWTRAWRGAFLAAAAFLLWRERASLLRLVGFAKVARGADLYVNTALAFLASAALTRFGADDEPRYAVLLFTLIAPAFGVAAGALWGGGRIRRALAVALAALVLGVNANSIYAFERRLPAQPLHFVWDHTPVAADLSATYRTLEREGIDALFAEYWLGYRMIYETGERVVTVPGRYPPYENQARRARKRAWMVRPTPGELARLDDLGRALRSVGISTHRVDQDGLALLVPEDEGLDPQRWQVRRASGVDPASAFDRDLRTRFTTAADQKPGQVLEIDLGEEVALRSVGLLFDSGDAPRKLEVEVSADGSTWKHSAESLGAQEAMSLDLGAVSGRYLRFTQLGSLRGRWWSIRELFVFPAAR